MKRILVLLLVLLLAVPTGCSKEKESSTIKLGWISALTTGAASFGVPARRAADLAVEEINASGGINGKKLELIIEDGQANAKKASDAAQKLVNIDKVPVVFGNCSTETLAASAICEPAHIITFGCVSVSPKISSAGDYTFRISQPDTEGVKLLVDHIWSKGYKTVAILTANDAYTLSNKDDFTKYYKEKGGEALTFDFNPDAKDLRSELTQIKNSKAQALVFFPLYAANAGESIKQMKELDMKLPLFGNRVVASTDCLKVAGDLLEGFISHEVKFDKKDPKVQSFLEKYKKKYGEEPNYTLNLIVGCYDAIHLIADAIKTSGTSPDKIRDFLYQVKDYDTTAGKLTIDKNGDPHYPFALKVIKKGELIDLE